MLLLILSLPVGGNQSAADDTPSVSLRDFKSLDQAHDALPSSGGTINVPAGTYDVESNFVITKRIHIKGVGDASTLRALTDAVTRVITVAPDLTGITIEDLRIEGSQTGAVANYQRGIHVESRATDITIRNVTFSGPRDGVGLNFGVDLVNTIASVVTGSRFERLVSAGGNGVGVLIEGIHATGNRIERNVFDGSRNGGPDRFAAALFVASGAMKTDLVGNVIKSWPATGIAVNDSTYGGINKLPLIADTTIRGNEVRGSKESGIVITAQTARTSIVENTVAENRAHGIVVEGNNFESLEVPIDTVITGNNVDGNGRDGIYIAGAIRTEISRNRIFDNGRLVVSSGVQVTHLGGASIGADNIVRENTITGRHVFGIRIDHDVPRTRVERNQIEGALGVLVDYGTGTNTDDQGTPRLPMPALVVATLLLSILGLFVLHRLAGIFDPRRVGILSVFTLSYVVMLVLPMLGVIPQHPYDNQIIPFAVGVVSVLLTVPLGVGALNRVLNYRREEDQRFFQASINAEKDVAPRWILVAILAIGLALMIVNFILAGRVPLLGLLSTDSSARELAEQREQAFKLLDPRWSAATATFLFYAFLFLRTHLFPLLLLITFGALLVRPSRASWVLFVASALASGFYAASSLARAPLAALVMRTAHYFYLHRRAVVGWRIGTLGVIAALTFPVVVTTFGYGSAGALDGIRRVLFRLVVTPADDLYAYFLIFPGQVPFQMGGTLLKPVQTVLGLPNFYIENYVYRFTSPDGLATGHANAAFPSNLYADFGLFGVVAGGVLVGALIQAIHISLSRRPKTVATVAIYSFLVYAFWVLNFGSVTSVLGTNGGLFSIAAIALLWLRDKVGGRPLRGTRSPPRLES